MHAWEAIQKAVDHIEEHLTGEISAEQLAETVSLSPFYFQRLFKRLVNRTVQEYIKLRRLARAAGALNDGDQRILDVALAYGFSSHANFTRVFKEAYGITPEEYKKSHPLLNTVIKPEISMSYMMMDEGVPLIVGNMVLEIQRKKLAAPERYAGFETNVAIASQIPVGESTGIDLPGQLWAHFHARKSALTPYADPAVELGLSSMPDPQKGVFKYFAGVLLQDGLTADNNFTLQELPAGDYIVCRIEAENFKTLVTEALDKAGKYLFGTWLPNHRLATEPFSAEKYYTDCDCGCRMELWVKPIPIC